MQRTENRTSILLHKGSAPAHCLAETASRWDRTIYRELRHFAQYLWPNARLLGLIPIHSYRLRKQSEPEQIVWWVERDIPPFDRYLCEAYRVELSLAGPDQPRLVVRSGMSTYPVVPISIEALKAALVQAGADTPLIIHRQFGPALDP
jgi:hypothetical protein